MFDQIVKRSNRVPPRLRLGSEHRTCRIRIVLGVNDHRDKKPLKPATFAGNLEQYSCVIGGLRRD